MKRTQQLLLQIPNLSPLGFYGLAFLTGITPSNSFADTLEEILQNFEKMPRSKQKCILRKISKYDREYDRGIQEKITSILEKKVEDNNANSTEHS